MDTFLRKICDKISVDYLRLSIVRNLDGFLYDKTIQNAISQECGIEFISGSQIQLRMHYELEFKKDPSSRFCYLCKDNSTILPDMIAEANTTDFSIAEVFPNFANKQLLRTQSFPVLHSLYSKHVQGNVSMAETKRLIDSILSEISSTKSKSQSDYINELKSIEIDWDKFNDTIHSVSNIVNSAIKDGVYDGIEPIVDEINADFQNWVDRNYFGALHTNPLMKARSVNTILPHIAAKHSVIDKVALVVVDGMSYWQYMTFKMQLEKVVEIVTDDTIFAWMPTITMLSRQAIFRGSDPVQNYRQNPQNEEKLWKQFWIDKGIPAADVQYFYGGDDLYIYSTTKRIALVSAELDEDMHVLKTNEDLLAVTDNWAKRFTKKIAALKEAGFSIYITTDHGNVLSHGWRTLTSAEKTHLYVDGSKGSRHLIFNTPDEMHRFENSNPETGMLLHGIWLVFRDTKCFNKAQNNIITHGGSHFFEVLIPLAKV